MTSLGYTVQQNDHLCLTIHFSSNLYYDDSQNRPTALNKLLGNVIFLCVCMCVCERACMHACMHVCVHVFHYVLSLYHYISDFLLPVLIFTCIVLWC